MLVYNAIYVIRMFSDGYAALLDERFWRLKYFVRLEEVYRLLLLLLFRFTGYQNTKLNFVALVLKWTDTADSHTLIIIGATAGIQSTLIAHIAAQLRVVLILTLVRLVD